MYSRIRCASSPDCLKELVQILLGKSGRIMQSSVDIVFARRSFAFFFVIGAHPFYPPITSALNDRVATSGLTPNCLNQGVHPIHLWPFCGRNSQHTTDNEWVRNGKRCKKPRNSLVAATFEKANTYVFAAPIIRDREVGGSNPLAPTNNLLSINYLQS